MPRYKRPESSILADFEEHETARAWGIDDDVEDLSAEEKAYLGLYPPRPEAPPVAGYDERKPLLPVAGRRDRPSDWQEKVKAEVKARQERGESPSTKDVVRDLFEVSIR